MTTDEMKFIGDLCNDCLSILYKREGMRHFDFLLLETKLKEVRSIAKYSIVASKAKSKGYRAKTLEKIVPV